MLTSLALCAFGAAAAVPNNLRPGLLPPAGAWRGAELGSMFVRGGEEPSGEKLVTYSEQYGRYPLHVYRQFNTTLDNTTRDWVKRGGILWYNIKFDGMSWASGARGGYNSLAHGWAGEVRSLAPAQVYVTIYHEPDHNVCFSKCTRGGMPGNTPANYRGMWRQIQGVFQQENVSNAVWVIDYSSQIGSSAANMSDPCVDDSCYPAAAVAPLYPGGNAIDWVFFNLFEKAKKGRVKADFPTMLNASITVLRNANSSKSCVAGCDFASKPWGLGAFASHGLGSTPVPTPDRIKFFQDTTSGMASHPGLKAYLYFDSLDSEVPFNGSAPQLNAALKQYLGSKAFLPGDAGAPHANGSGQT